LTASGNSFALALKPRRWQREQTRRTNVFAFEAIDFKELPSFSHRGDIVIVS
jgi:hypothetical protein